jgi:pimeloyl-ACP methyl ester carboxylesterase
VIERERIANDGGAATVWTGGEGDPLVLLHGGWGGAQLHWAPVWDELARTFRVIAPELPGFAEASPQAPRSLTGAAAWWTPVVAAEGVRGPRAGTRGAARRARGPRAAPVRGGQ